MSTTKLMWIIFDSHFNWNRGRLQIGYYATFENIAATLLVLMCLKFSTIGIIIQPHKISYCDSGLAVRCAVFLSHTGIMVPIDTRTCSIEASLCSACPFGVFDDTEVGTLNKVCLSVVLV